MLFTTCLTQEIVLPKTTLQIHTLICKTGGAGPASFQLGPPQSGPWAAKQHKAPSHDLVLVGFDLKYSVMALPHSYRLPSKLRNTLMPLSNSK